MDIGFGAGQLFPKPLVDADELAALLDWWEARP